MRHNIIVVLAAIFILDGCASNEKYSGFLSDYSILKPAAKDRNTLVYANHDVDWSEYDRVMIDNVAIVTPDGQKKTENTLLHEIALSYAQKLKQHLGQQFNVVDTAGTHTLRLEAAITSVYASYDDLKGYQYIPVGAAVTGAMRLSGISRPSARMMAEGRLVDANNGKLLAEAIDLKAGKIEQSKDAPITLNDLEPVLELWASRLTDRLVEVKEHVREKNLNKAGQ